MEYKPKPVPPENINNKHQNPVEFLTKAIAILLFILSCVYLATHFVPPVLTALTPMSVEKKLGDVLFKSKFKNVTKPKYELLALWDEIKSISPETLKDTDLYIMESEEENAFATPGNKIFLTRKFLKNAESRNEKTFVIGHELGHQYHRHPIKSVYSGLISTAALSVLTGAGSFSELMLDATTKVFSREQETEADMFGLNLVQEISGNAKGAFEFFRRMSTKYGFLENLNGGVFSTHPLSKKRIKHLESVCIEKFKEAACL